MITGDTGLAIKRIHKELECAKHEYKEGEQQEFVTYLTNTYRMLSDLMLELGIAV